MVSSADFRWLHNYNKNVTCPKNLFEKALEFVEFHNLFRSIGNIDYTTQLKHIKTVLEGILAFAEFKVIDGKEIVVEDAALKDKYYQEFALVAILHVLFSSERAISKKEISSKLQLFFENTSVSVEVVNNVEELLFALNNNVKQK